MKKLLMAVAIVVVSVVLSVGIVGWIAEELTIEHVFPNGESYSVGGVIEDEEYTIGGITCYRFLLVETEDRDLLYEKFVEKREAE